jgi:hypothetical protein
LSLNLFRVLKHSFIREAKGLSRPVNPKVEGSNLLLGGTYKFIIRHPICAFSRFDDSEFFWLRVIVNKLYMFHMGLLFHWFKPTCWGLLAHWCHLSVGKALSWTNWLPFITWQSIHLEEDSWRNTHLQWMIGQQQNATLPEWA